MSKTRDPNETVILSEVGRAFAPNAAEGPAVLGIGTKDRGGKQAVILYDTTLGIIRFHPMTAAILAGSARAASEQPW